MFPGLYIGVFHHHKTLFNSGDNQMHCLGDRYAPKSFKRAFEHLYTTSSNPSSSCPCKLANISVSGTNPCKIGLWQHLGSLLKTVQVAVQGCKQPHHGVSHDTECSSDPS